MTTLRNRIDSAFERLGRLVYRNRLKTLLLMVVLMAGLFSQLPKMKFDTSNESYFHKDDPTIANYAAFRDQFGREEFVLIAITPPEIFDRAFLEILAEFHDALESDVPYVEDVTSLVNVRNTRGEGDRLIVEDLLEDMPTTPEEMALLRERVLSSRLYKNFLISEDGAMTVVVLESFAYSPGEEADGELLEGFDDDATANGDPARVSLTVEENRELVRGVEAVIARFDAPDFPLRMTGGPAFNDFFEQMMQADMGRFLTLAILVIAILLFILFRRIYGVVLPLLVVVLSLVSTISLMAATGVPFTIPTTILPSFLLATGVGASVHLLTIFLRDHREHGDRERAIVYAMGHSGLPILMTGLTTAAGLYAFSTAEMAPVAHLGIFSGTGVLIALVYTLVLMPALLSLWPVRQHPRLAGDDQSKGLDGMLVRIADFATGHPWPIVLVSAVIVATSVVGLTRLNFVMDFVTWLPEDLGIRTASDLIDKEMKGSINLEIVIDTGEENGLYDAEVLNGMEELARYAEAYLDEDGKTFVGKTNSVVDVLKETHQALNENRPEFYAVPQNRNLVAQELLLFENSGSDDLEQVVDSLFSKARLSLIVPNKDAAAYVNFVADLEEEAARQFGAGVTVTITGTLNLFTQMIFTMMRSMAKSYLIAGIVITLMMMLLMGSFRLGALTMVINFTPILVTLGLVMGFSGINLDVFTLTIGSIALGLAVDDTIHFFHNFRRYFGETGDTAEAVRRTFLSSGRAMLFTTLVLVAGFWLFMFATMNNIADFGLLTGIALILALASDFLLAPAILVLVNRTKRGREICERWCEAEAA